MLPFMLFKPVEILPFCHFLLDYRAAEHHGPAFPPVETFKKVKSFSLKAKIIKSIIKVAVVTVFSLCWDPFGVHLSSLKEKSHKIN